MSTGALVVEDLRAAEDATEPEKFALRDLMISIGCEANLISAIATVAKPTALLLASSPRAEAWRYIFGSTTVPIKALMPRQTILPGIGHAFVLDVDVSRLDAGQIERAAETIAKRFDVPIDEVRQGIMGEHGLPILCDELAATTLRFCDGCNADLGALAPHASACEYQRPSSPPEPASATPAWNVCPACETHVDAVDVYDGTELRCFACEAELVVVELAEDAWSLQLIERGSGYDHDDESLLPNRKRIGATTESIALVANVDGSGVVLAFDGRGIWSMIDGVGPEIDNLGLDDGPSGLSIWEGKCRSLGDGDDDAELVGAFRALMPEEWKRLAETGVPWAFDEGED